MKSKALSFGMAALVSVTALIPAAPALARDRGYSDYDRGYYENSQYDRRYANQNRRDRRYANRNYRDYRGYDNGYQRCDKGTTGLIIGAIAGGLLGREVIGRRGDRTAGAIVGAGAGALAGRAIDRSDGRRC